MYLGCTASKGKALWNSLIIRVVPEMSGVIWIIAQKPVIEENNYRKENTGISIKISFRK